jgi:hypothetical protein
LGPFHELLGQVLIIATRFNKQLLERASALLVIPPVLLEAALDDGARNRLVTNALRDGLEQCEKE